MYTFLTSMSKNVEKTCDICIVGGGAAGLEIARELRNSDLSVIVLESGFQDYDWETQRLCRFEQTGHRIRTGDHDVPFGPYEAYVQEFRYRGFGGTLNLWGRRWMKMEPSDFKPTPHSTLPGWPISLEDLYPYYQRVANDYGFPELLLPIEQLSPEKKLLPQAYEEFAIYPYIKMERMQNLVPKYYVLLEPSQNINVIMGANATEIRLSDDLTHVVQVTARSLKGQECVVRAKQFVLAAGAIENARLLLCSNRQIKKGVGNNDGWVGRNFIDHLKKDIATFTPASRFVEVPEAIEYLVGQKAIGFDISLNPAIREQCRLPNHALEFTFDDKTKTCSVKAFIEQIPNADSQMALGQEKDELGLPITTIDWRVTEQDHISLQEFMEKITGYYKQRDLGQFQLYEDAYDLEKAVDSSHQMGTTRMAEAPQHGVVDKDCRVFGVDNLFVVGTSVFPKCGNANPTFTILALARRLADLLRK